MTFIKQLVKQIFQYEARLILKKYAPHIIAITGSVGKTTTRDAIYAVMSKIFFVRKSEKSFTTELGIPLTIIGCSYGTGTVWQWIKNMCIGLRLLFKREQYPHWLILEIDGDKPGDFAALSDWFHPNILVVTAIGEIPAHVESFGTVEQLITEKKVLLNTVLRDGMVVYNIDDTLTSQLVTDTELKKISCGIAIECDIRGSIFSVLYSTTKEKQIPTGMTFNITTRADGPKEKNTVTFFDSLGVHAEYASLIAYAVGRELGLAHENMIASLNQYKTLPGRMEIISGVKDTIIIDDSYNASPVAMQESLQIFNSLTTSLRKVAVVGDMFELGKYSVEEHKKIAGFLTDTAYVIAVGIRMRGMVEELLSRGFDGERVISVDTAEQAGEDLQKILVAGDIVFVKGSQAMRMERVVRDVMRHPEDAPKLLVRQEPEWLSRD